MNLGSNLYFKKSSHIAVQYNYVVECYKYKRPFWVFKEHILHVYQNNTISICFFALTLFRAIGLLTVKICAYSSC